MKLTKRYCHSAFIALLICAYIPFFVTVAHADSERLSAEEQAKLYPDTMHYTIRRKGKNVGTHTVSFNQDSNGLSVDVESKITVTVLKVPVFRFKYISFEYWQGGKLVSLSAATDRNGDVTRAKLVPDSTSQSSNHWNPAVLDSNSIFNTITGNISNVSIQNIGDVTLSSGEDSIAATHYRYTGDIQADVWYDSKNRWAKLQFKGDDGSNIIYTANPLVISP